MGKGRSDRSPSRREPPLQIVDRGTPRTSRAFLRRVVEATLQFAGREDLRISLLLADDAELARLHGEFLADPTPTDVLSFEIEGAAEIAVSVETARRCAARTGHDPTHEIALYVVHGLLHVCGFDDANDRDRERMREAERAVLARLSLRVADVDESDSDRL